jgi:hypothetical protein
MSPIFSKQSSLALAVITLAYVGCLAYILSGGYRILSSDELAYLAIAESYANLDLVRAINGMRPALPSLFAAPFVAFGGIGDITLVRFPGYFFGLVLLWMVFVYAGTLSISPWRRLAIVLPLIPLVVWFSMSLGSDMIAGAFGLAFLLMLSNGRFLSSDRSAIACGLLFGFSLLAKTFLFYLSIVLLVFGFFYHFFFRHGEFARKLIIRRTVIIMLIVGVMGTAWAGILSIKYGYFSLGAAGRHNFYLQNPDWVKKGWYFPHKTTTNVGLLELPHPQAASYIEDGTFIVDQLSPIYAWSPFDSVASFRWFLGTVRWRLDRHLLPQSGAQSPLTLGLIIAAGLLLFSGRHAPHFRANLFSLAALTVAMGAILSVNFKFVYVFGFVLSSLCIVSSYIFQLHDRKILAPLVGPLAVLMLATSFSVLQVKPMLLFRAEASIQGKQPLQHELETRAAALKPHLSGRRLASTTEFAFSDFSRLCFLARCGYLGNPKFDAPWAEQLRELRSFRVEFFAMKPVEGACGKMLPGMETVNRQPISGVCLWRVLPLEPRG